MGMHRSTPQYRSKKGKAAQYATGRTRGNRPPRKERGYCTHGMPRGQCSKRHRDDEGAGSPTAQ